MHSEFNAVVYSSGLEIAAREGTVVRAAGSGRVVHSDWLEGYGRVMIVDHGNGLFTMYGHLQDVLVVTKQEVRQGMPIGTVGNTGSVGSPSLYFEVRDRGRAKDPRSYLSRSSS
jgi:septal ring factor EnvC (AmiA/AmiB activator)